MFGLLGLLRIFCKIRYDWLTNSHPIGSIGNPMKYKKTQNIAIKGVQIAVYETATSAHCAYKCRGHLRCRMATYWINLTCHLHSKSSNNGTVLNDQAINIDFMQQESRFLIIGGRNVSTNLDTLYAYVPETKTVTKINRKLVLKRNRPVTGVWKNKVFINQGIGTEMFEKTFPISSKNVDFLPLVARSKAQECGGISNDQFYTCFGINTASTFLTNCDVYSLKEGDNYNHIVLNVALPTPVKRMSCAIKDNYMYVTGGKTSTGPLTNKAWRINLSDASKTALANHPTAHDAATSVWFQGGVLLCGGYGPGGSQNRCDKYNVNNNTWTPFPPMTLLREFFTITKWGDQKLLAIAGKSSTLPIQGLLSRVDLFENGSWTYYHDLPFAIQSHAVIDLDDEG